MPFFHVDDGFHGHKKLARLGVEDFHAIALWTVAGSWSSDNLEDGFVPDYIAAKMHPDYKEFASALVRVGLWEVAEKGGESGWQFHDWTGPGRNPSAEQVLKERAANAERQREFRSRVKGTKPKGEPPEPSGRQGGREPDEPPMDNGDTYEGRNGDSNAVTEPLVTDGVRDPVPFRSFPFRSNEENPSTSPTATPSDDALFEAETVKKIRKPRAPKAEQDLPGQRADVDALCQRLVDLMVANGCREPNVGKTWRTEARLLLDNDKVKGKPITFDQAMWLLEWCQRSKFWRKNIHSMPTFREKFDRLRQDSEDEWAEKQRRRGIPGQRPSVEDRVLGTLSAAEELAREFGEIPPEPGDPPLATVTYLHSSREIAS